MDKRRRQYVPIASQIAFTSAGTKLLEKWGMEGLCTWMLFLAACKREFDQGVFGYTSEPEAWGKLGAEATSFTIEEFFTYTGQQKMTSRRRDGRITHVSCTSWKEWNKEFASQLKAERNPRKQHTNGFAQPSRYLRDTSTEFEVEVDSELEREERPLSAVREIYDHWRTVCGKTDARYDKISDARRQKITARLKEFSAAELKQALDGVAADPWEDRRHHNDLTKVFRSRENVDRFLEVGADPSLLSTEERLRRHFANLEERQ